MPTFSKLFCIDGSGAKDQRKADLKRPIYEVQFSDEKRAISRIQLGGETTALAVFREHCRDAIQNKARILIAADVVIGLPREPVDVWKGYKTFPKWLESTGARLKKNTVEWRDGLVADSLDERSAERPFTKVKKGTKKKIAFKRMCDEITNGESVYCIDSGAKQVGRASLQFWFEVLLPLRNEFGDKVAIWPFEETKGKSVVVAECYPTACQRQLKLPGKIKRKPPRVVEELLKLKSESEKIEVEENAWYHAVSSEDEYDTFTTAYAFAKQDNSSDLMWAPTGDDYKKIRIVEGWMLGLQETARLKKKSRKKTNNKNDSKSKASTPEVGKLNRNRQENCGPTGRSGKKGPLIGMRCRLEKDGVECGHKYETNSQDVFQKKCPECGGGR